MVSQSIELLKDLDPADAAAIMEFSVRLRLPAGAVLFRLGGEADSVFAIETGRVALSLPMEVGGREQDVLVEERTAGETVGWSALVPPHRFTLTARASIDSEVLAFSRAALVGHFASRPAIGLVVTANLASVMGQRLQVLQAMWLREIQRVVQLTLAGQAAV